MIYIFLELGFKLYEITSNGLTNSLSDDIPLGQYFQTFFYPETYNVVFVFVTIKLFIDQSR